MIYLRIYSIKLYHLLMISALFIVNNCAPLQGDNDATILFYNYENNGNGNYNFRFGTSNGITREETGTLVDVGLPSEHISVQGSYTYINLEGETITLNYTADENGYTALSPSIPPPPPQSASPISPGVLASLLGK